MSLPIVLKPTVSWITPMSASQRVQKIKAMLTSLYPGPKERQKQLPLPSPGFPGWGGEMENFTSQKKSAGTVGPRLPLFLLSHLCGVSAPRTCAQE